MDAILEKKKQSEAKKIIFDPFSGEQRQTVPSIKTAISEQVAGKPRTPQHIVEEYE